MSKAVPDGIRSYFEEFCKRLQACGHRQPRCGIGKMLSLDKASIEFLLGDLGRTINDFLSCVDSDHPETPICHNGLFGDESNFPRILGEALASLSSARSCGNSTAEEILRRHARGYVEEIFPEVCKIDTPDRNRCNVRMVCDKSRRDHIRGQKKMQLITMESVCRKGCGYFESHPDNFQRYMLFDKSLDAELERLEFKARRYEHLGCLAMASEMRSTLLPYHEQVKSSHYGFNRIAMSVASMILARNVGFKARSLSPYHDCDIQVSREYVGEHLLPSDQSEVMDYEPAVYPLGDFSGQITANIKGVVETLDCFPDAGGKPIFDFFGVIVPSVRVRFQDGYVGFVDECGAHRLFQNYNDFKSEFDKFMVKIGLFRPVLVAEKDHKCYFVTHWL